MEEQRVYRRRGERYAGNCVQEVNSRHVGSQVRASATGRAVPYETTVHLRQRLRSLVITVPASWGRKTILQLYKENFNENHTVSGGASAVQHSSPVSSLSSVHAVPSCDVTPQYSHVNSGNSDSSTSIPATVTTASNQLSSANVELMGVMREMRDMMTSLTQRLSPGAPSGENIAWPISQTQRNVFCQIPCPMSALLTKVQGEKFTKIARFRKLAPHAAPQATPCPQHSQLIWVWQDT
ncbi:uncharacterized protein LOC124118307 [Haliotis rufescens]|uniref:uncharacterized protein LOC124118307 n=1 Tax=Haliotis rufescens TaxID=6454 RepID=UPI00201FB277|nr:uncharacterized protein LOC124118307 [Haliotis rufescens]